MERKKEERPLSVGPIEPVPPGLAALEIDAVLDAAQDETLAGRPAAEVVRYAGLDASDTRILAYADERLMGALKRVYAVRIEGVLEELKGAYDRPDAELAKLARLYQTWQAVLDDLEHFPKACRKALEDTGEAGATD